MNKEIFQTKSVELDKLSETLLTATKGKDITTRAGNLQNYIHEFIRGGTELISDSDTLRIGIVGQVKTGKSSFLNSLFFNGENVLPKASTPMTAGLTILEYGQNKKVIIEYYNSKEWKSVEEKATEFSNAIERYKKNNPNLSESGIENLIQDDIGKSARELIDRCGYEAKTKIHNDNLLEELEFSSFENMQILLEKYVGATGCFTSVVKSLRICVNDERLRGIQVIDTPGVNDPIVSRENRTREFLQTCHGVFFLSYAGQFFTGVDTNFLSNRINSAGIGSVVMLASKFDSVLQDEGMKYRDRLEDAWAACEDNLKQRFREIIKSYQGRKILFDVVSGISYSISIKEPNRWDSIEHHVISRFKDLYPSSFKNDDDVKETFMELSGIEHIKTKYLEGEFVGRKQAIISEKVEEYFIQQAESLKESTQSLIDSATSRIESINSTDIEVIRVRKATCEATIKAIVETFQNHSDKVRPELDTRVLEIFNEHYLSWDDKIPTEPRTKKIVAIDAIDVCLISFDTSKKVPYNTPNTAELKRQLKKLTGGYIDEISKSWEKMADAMGKSFSAKMMQSLTKQEQETLYVDVNNKDLEEKIEETLSEIHNHTTLKWKPLREVCMKVIDDLCDSPDMQFEPDDSYDVRPANIENEVKNEYQRFINGTINPRVTWSIKTINDQIVKDIEKGRDKLKDFLGETSGMIQEILEKKFKEANDSMEKDLLNKEQSLEQYKQIANILSQIKTSLNNA